MQLGFATGEAAQVDFGAGPVVVDLDTGEEINTWFFPNQNLVLSLDK